MCEMFSLGAQFLNSTNISNSTFTQFGTTVSESEKDEQF